MGPGVGESAAIRAAAARTVAAVAFGGRTLEAALAAHVRGSVPRPAVQSIAFGTVRWYLELDACLARMRDRTERLQPEIHALVLAGLYQLLHGATPEHAAVSETVEAARSLGRARAAGLVNALLRRFQREREALLREAHHDAAARHAHPAWMLAAFERDWTDDWPSLIAAGNTEPPMWLRVNVRRGGREDYRARLEAAGMPAESCAFAEDALLLAEPVDVARLPGFANGEVSVQDAAAQIAPYLLDARAGMRVLDACAAPGGKTCHVLEREPRLAELVALDIDADRAARITSNLSRLGLEATVCVGDAAAPASWWDGRPFERILLDVPCSGTGVIRRHPDIKLLRRATDIPRFAAQQAALLGACFALLAPAGRLVYASCSILRDENAAVVGDFLDAEPAAVDVTESARLLLPGTPPWRQERPGFALPSGAAGADGFYYACLEKRT
jgi:16S rRNA (cytosine967-C5)-methyltransferase